VHDLLAQSGLEHFYELSQQPGVRPTSAVEGEQWAYLDQAGVQERLLDFADGKVSHVTFHIPSIHCVACVWLLENLFRLHQGIAHSQVNFGRREVAVQFIPEQIRPSELVGLLASLGYEPALTLNELEPRQVDASHKRRWIQVGVAGFAFGNIMLFSLPRYLGLDSLSGPLFERVFGWLSLLLAAPVLLYSASDYWKSALLAARRRVLTLEVPIAVGLAAIYTQSAFEILAGRGEGYCDSLTGLIFLLLCGRAFQQKTQDRLAFDRDYKSFFPLSVRRKVAEAEECIALSELGVGDRIVIRNGELVPADARLRAGLGCIDYSFVTGESEPVTREVGAYLYAGGKQIGGEIEVETVKAVSQSYLMSLWDHQTFRKTREDGLDSLTNRYSRRFTRMVLGVAIGAGLFWIVSGDWARGLKAFTSVLIVACPCALALAAPFALGTAQRLLARLGVFVRNGLVIERLAQVDALVFDKTGTLTEAGGEPRFDGRGARAGGKSEIGTPKSGSRGRGAGEPLSEAEVSWVYALARQSTHPQAKRVAAYLNKRDEAEAASSFREEPGGGIAGTVDGHEVLLGSQIWLRRQGICYPEQSRQAAGSVVHVAIDGEFRGVFLLPNALRPETEPLLRGLGQQYDLVLLSGDSAHERARFRELFGCDAQLHFNQSPFDKLGFIERLQASGKRVMMVGDGLNDAGALKQSDVGVAVVERVGTFSPASDIILEAKRVPGLAGLLRFARRTARTVRMGLAISAVYNLVGTSIAAAGLLSPLVCAVLMPISSVSVVLFACGATAWAARKESWA
jgi:Cu+-exporting ATPase